jgi:hypothetical protein
MSERLNNKQAELDEIEAKLIENKNTRVKLGEEARELRTRYLKVQDEREELLKEELGGTN